MNNGRSLFVHRKARIARANRISADRQALLAEIRIKYADGTEEVFGTGTDWQVSEGGNWLEADLYDGEVYDASADINNNVWRSATIERLKINPEIIAETGSPVRAHEVFSPISCTKRADGELIYDFGQNFAGVIRAEIEGKAGEFTYMGFRYVGVKGADEENLKLSAVALYSDVESCGSFSCSDERINKLQSNIVWGAKSNFVEIPTDCPQRDERMGWTGDIAVFAPWAEYMARGDKRLPENMYPVMKKYVKACMAHAPSSALRRLGCARREQDERMAEAQQVDGNGEPVPHFAAYGAGGRNSRPRRRGEILQ